MLLMQEKTRKKSPTENAEPPKKHKKQKKHSSFGKALNGTVCFILSLYVLTSVIFTEGSGTFGGIIKSFLMGCFGPIGAIGISVSLTLIFFFGGVLRRSNVMGRKIFLSITGILLAVTVYHLAVYGIPTYTGIVDLTGDLWVNALNGKSGGVIGGLLAMGMGFAIGRIPSIVVLSIITVILLSFAVCSSPFGIWATVGDLLCIERAPKSKDKKGKKNAPKEQPADVLRSLIPVEPTFSENDREFESAIGDILPITSGNNSSVTDEEYYTYDDGDGVYDSREYADEHSYGDSYSYDDTLSVDAESREDRAYVHTDEDEDDGEYEEENYPVLPTATTQEEATVSMPDIKDDTEDYDGNDDSDPFETVTVATKSRKFGKLFGMKNEKRSSEGRAELEKAAEAEKEAESTEETTKKWEKGNKYAYPSTTLLNTPPEKRSVSEEEVREVADKILKKLASFKVKASLVGYSIGPSITRYELAPGEGVRVSKISQLITDISLELASEGVRIEAPIPGKSAIGIEVPNRTVSLVSFRALAEDPRFTKAKSKITVCIGQSVTGETVFMDIDDMPHVLIAGQTKSGKSVAINCMLLSLLYRVSPDEVKLILIDPKRVEFNIYSRLPHLVMPVIDDPTKAAAALSWAVKEMERRYELMKEYDARNRDEYLENTADIPDRDAFPQIVIIIDELADLMLQVREHVEPLINRIAAKARACGMHLLVGTQRPSADVVTGLIKANIPARISFKVADQVDARIIGTAGAEKLLGKGDMLYHPTGGAKTRVQGAFVGGAEILRVIDYIVENNGEAAYDPDVLAQLEEEENSMLRVKKRGGAPEEDLGGGDKRPDPLLINAIEIAVENQSVSTSSLQRYLEVGYGRGAKLIDSMERLGIVGPPNGSKPREVFMTMEQYHVWRLEQNFDN